MVEPTLVILGVYKPQISEETWKQQWETSEDDEGTKEHFDGLILIEAVVDGLTEPLDLGKFGQMSLEFPDDPNRMLVGYDEGLLSSDGELLIERGIDCVEGTGPLRFAVYLHCYDAHRPIQWQCGSVACPPVQDAPVRLMLLMPYCPL